MRSYCGTSGMIRLWEIRSPWWVGSRLEDEWVWQGPQCCNRPGTLKRTPVSPKMGTGTLEIWSRLALSGQPLLFFLAQCLPRTGMSDMTLAYCWESPLETWASIPTAYFTSSPLTSCPRPFIVGAGRNKMALYSKPTKWTFLLGHSLGRLMEWWKRKCNFSGPSESFKKFKTTIEKC